MDKLDANLALRVGNALIEPIEDCRDYKATAAKLMIGPNTARLSALQEMGLVYVPLPEANIELYSEAIFDNWQESIRSGICLLEDYYHGEFDEPDPQLRFNNCARLKYESVQHFWNCCISGRFLLWIDFPNVFLSRDFLEVSGFCCPPEKVQQVFGKSLREMVDEFSAYADLCPISDGRGYYVRLARHYSEQWALS